MDIVDLENMIDDFQASEHEQSNCLFQLSLMVARFALSPMSEEYEDQACQTMLELIREKRRYAPVVNFPPPQLRKPKAEGCAAELTLFSRCVPAAHNSPASPAASEPVR